jgi:hypothetical protein
MSAVEASVFRHPSSTVDQVVLNADGSFGGELASELGSKLDVAGGKILQIVSVNKTDVFTTTSTSYTDITGLSLSITPTLNTSKVLVIASVVAGTDNALGNGAIKLVRDSTDIFVGDASASRTVASFGISFSAVIGSQQATLVTLDAPSLASAVTYKVQALTSNAGGPVVVNRSINDGTTSTRFVGASSITLLEVSA